MSRFQQGILANFSLKWQTEANQPTSIALKSLGNLWHSDDSMESTGQ